MMTVFDENKVYNAKYKNGYGTHLFMNMEFGQYGTLNEPWIRKGNRVHIYFSRHCDCITNQQLRMFVAKCQKAGAKTFIHLPRDCYHLKDEIYHAIRMLWEYKFLLEHRNVVGCYKLRALETIKCPGSVVDGLWLNHDYYQKVEWDGDTIHTWRYYDLKDYIMTGQDEINL